MRWQVDRADQAVVFHEEISKDVACTYVTAKAGYDNYLCWRFPVATDNALIVAPRMQRKLRAISEVPLVLHPKWRWGNAS